jgi:activator of 2-hydroxyglutaryl-CoA dehydratase
MTGGVALNRGIVHALERELGFSVLIAEQPQFIAAAGAAVLAQEAIDKGAGS